MAALKEPIPLNSITQSEENYLKAIFYLSEKENTEVSTNKLANYLSTKPASVSEMLKKLDERNLVKYQKYKGVSLTNDGRTVALNILRKHRLWEVFLVQKLSFSWHEVHEVAEQLEHIRSTKLFEKLDEYLGFPEYDPHGDPIPTSEGQLKRRKRIMLSDADLGIDYELIAVNETDNRFLKHLDKLHIKIGTELRINDKHEFDNSIHVLIDKERIISLSEKAAQNIFLIKK